VIPDGAEKGPFLARYGAVYEHSPWVAEGAWAYGPFEDTEQLHAAMVHTVREASRERRLELIRAHPDLAARVAMTPASEREQASAGLDRLTPEEYEEFQRVNAAYRERFGFPFVICVREHTTDSILSAARERVAHGADEEIDTALTEIAKIARLRLEDVC